MPHFPPKPPFGPDFAAFLKANPPYTDILPEHIAPYREGLHAINTAETALAGEKFTHEEREAKGPHGPVLLSIFRPEGTGTSTAPTGQMLPVVYFMHSGGTLMGNRFTGVKEALRWARTAGAACVSVEYRHAPENPYPVPLDDCFAGLHWIAAKGHEVGLDSSRIVVTGQSAGGNLATAVAMLARDRGGPPLRGQLLDCPMLDDRNTTVSSHQFTSSGTWLRNSNIMAWKQYLGPNAGKPGVSPLAAPSRAKATDLRGLPPTLVSIGEADMFRDEAVGYAGKLWEAGVSTEVHVWPGGFHCFEMLVPGSEVSEASMRKKEEWAKARLAKNLPSKL